MPTRADIEAATPRCHRRLIQKHTGSRQSGVHITCYRPMRYRPGRNTWICECGAEETGELLGARFNRLATEPLAA